MIIICYIETQSTVLIPVFGKFYRFSCMFSLKVKRIFRDYTKRLFNI